MKKLIFLSILCIYLITIVDAQTIKVEPYLQNASPNSIFIMWETDSGDESIVEWGLTENLGNTTIGTAFQSSGNSRIHEVKLEGLQRFTRYYYRVKTENSTSEIYKFKTPPFASDEESFRIIAMSDMQRDFTQPDKFEEIVQDGVIDYIQTTTDGELSDNIGLVLIPGDLVDVGIIYTQWENTFFDPAHGLFNEVPLYPVPGNHELNTDYFYQYFNLPQNGTIGFEEHWWHKDYGNVRIIGLDSNSPYDSQEQLDWFEEVLNSTCEMDSIDFVFAQLHHPHKSELWLAGESDFTGEVITLLETFTTSCGKPSIHFFGHTHGYSRGQSRDHKHLWVNVATAGGSVDNWGEFAQFDYDEFSVSQDEYGFVSVEVTAGDNPEFTLKRLSRGNINDLKDNELTDEVTIKLNASAIDTPQAVFPLDEEVKPECVVLKGTDFLPNDVAMLHGQSHWQIATDCSSFSTPLIETWKNFENHYYEVDTQAGDDLTDEHIIGLDENTSYCWRVRYRDREMNWSEWSAPASFYTSESQLSSNLINNAGAENEIVGWTVLEGALEALMDGQCNGISPYAGDYYFGIGGICNNNAFGRAVQNIDVSTYADSIDTGIYKATFGGYLSNYSGSDMPAIQLNFLDQNEVVLGSSVELSTLNSSWTLFSEAALIPAQTRIIQVEITGTRNAGTDNDSYIDGLFLRLGSESIDCSEFISSSKEIVDIPTLTVSPNPWSTKATISLPNHSNEVAITITNILGQTVRCPTTMTENNIQLDRAQLEAGTYFFLVKAEGKVIGNGRFVIQ